jgi:hypothetical protein
MIVTVNFSVGEWSQLVPNKTVSEKRDRMQQHFPVLGCVK